MTAKAPGHGLVGRESALDALRSGVDSAAAGRGRLLLVAGEAGIGKTALVRASTTEAAERGALVAWGQCWEGDGAPAYWPWVQVLRAAIAAGGDVGEATVLLPEHAADAATPVTVRGDARFRVFDAVVSCLVRLARRRPVVVVIDDLHWADEDSVRLLEFASRHVAASAVLLVGAYRDEEAPAHLRTLVATSEHVRLPGLRRDDVTALMAAVTGATPSDDVAADVWRRTGGNPFLVRELSRLLAAQGAYAHQRAAPAEAVAGVADILERRLARLSQPCADLLGFAAVVGPEARLDVLWRVADAPDTVPALLDEAVRARILLDPAAPVGPYRFSHDLFRETILAGLTAERRRHLHVAVGRALESLRDEGALVHPAELAAHFGAALGDVAADAVRYARLAGEDAASRLAFEETRAHYERALAALEVAAETDATDRLDVLLRLGDARNRAGAVKEAHRAYRDAAHLARSVDDATALARAAIGVHTLGWRHGHGEAIGLLEDAARALPTVPPSVLRAAVLAALARELHHAYDERDWERAPVLADEAVTIARQLDDPATLAFALLALHDAVWRPGTAAQRLRVGDEMLDASNAAGDADMVAQARLLRATALVEVGDPMGPRELEAYCRASDRLRHARARHGALSRRATAALIAGDLARATRLAGEALALGEAIGEAEARGVYETLMWAVSYVGGTWDAGDAGTAARLDSQPWPDLPLLEAVLHVAGGDLDAARHALSGLRVEDLPRTYDLEVYAFAAHAIAAAGTDDQRARLYERLMPHAGSHIVVGGCASYFGAVDHHLGLLARSVGREDDARGHFVTAAVLHDRLGAPAFARRSREEADASRSDGGPGHAGAGVLRRDGAVWTISYGGAEAHLPDSKGLRDLAVLLANPGRPVHAVELHTGSPPATGADDVLDHRAKAAFRRRLAELDQEIDEADAHHDPHRAERARLEREAIIGELSAAVGLGGRARRLGDEGERARKAVTARIRDAIARIEGVSPALGGHLREAIRTGTWCTYAPRS